MAEMRGEAPAVPPTDSADPPPTEGEPAPMEGRSATSTAASHSPSADSPTAAHQDSRGPTRGPNNPLTKKYLDLSGIDEATLPLPLKNRLRELRRIDVTEFPAGAAMLMRSVLEAAIKEHYGMKTGRDATGMLSAVMARVTADYGGERQLSHAISTVNRVGKTASTVPGTGEWFNLVTHSVNIDVGARQVQEAWRVTYPLVRFMLKPVAPTSPGS